MGDNKNFPFENSMNPTSSRRPSANFILNNLIITLGNDGAVLIKNNGQEKIFKIFPAFPLKHQNNIHFTGAGDVFLAGAATHYLFSKSIEIFSVKYR